MLIQTLINADDVNRNVRMGVVQTFGGKVPLTTDALLKLPGVGPYTAAAIASIAFGVPVAAIDGNIRRVYARLFAITGYLGEKETENQLKEIAQATLSKERPGDFNQALMDLGATICKPRNPLCYECPLKTVCLAFQKGLVSELPRRKEKPKVPHYVVTAAVISDGEKVLIAQRAKDDLLGGMWEFPGGKLEESDASLQTGLKREILEELGIKIDVGEAVGVYKHAYTHYKITLHAFMATLQHGESLDRPHGKPECEVFEWVLPEALSKYPMGKVDRLISKQLLGKRLTDCFWRKRTKSA